MERKLATVLFVDLVDSTALVAGADPEVVRRRVQTYFERVSHCVTTHGGIVEKFAGDAVMAAFGIPQAHEDDAERAVRAGLGILESVHELELEARIGVESGEVVADDSDSTFATGEAVNVAARLQQAAEPGQLLMGPGAHRLSLGRIEVDDVGPVDLKGLEQQVWAWRALSASGSSGARPHVRRAPLVGRDQELELLQNTYDRALRDKRAHLFTIYGEPGVGKSRLAHEFSEAIDGATVLSGRSLPYGEGVTYWPLAEMVKCAAGIGDDDPLDVAIEKLRSFCEDEVVADLLGLASGVLEAVQAERSQQEIAWAAREWAQRVAQEQPLVLIFEDIHWAEEPLLELIEHLATWVREAPLLLVSLARPELLDIRPGWGGGRVRATAIELEPLGESDSEELVDALADGGLTLEERHEVLAKTEGNPLYLEETVRMLSEDGAEGIGRIPDTLQALIAARIDRLAPEAKALLQRAAVIGRTFWEGALERLSPELESLEEPLDDLRLREFVLDEERSSIRGETAYKFKHVLIREVAYGGLSKSARAEHHARFAEWLKERAGEELLEIRAFHLDRATALLTELDGAAPAELQREAAEALTEAGLRAFAREANRAARQHFVRAVELEPTTRRRYLAARAADRLSDLPAVSREMEEVLAAAIQEGDGWTQGRALVTLAEAAVLREADVTAAEEMIDNALEVLEPDDHSGRYRALRARATIAWMRGDLAKEEQVMLEALELARASEHKGFESEAADELASVYLARLEFDRAEPLIEQAILLAEESGSAMSRGRALRFAGQLHLYRRELDDAEAALEAAREHLAEAGAAWMLGRTLNFAAWTARHKGDIARSERLFRESIRILTPLEDRATLCETQRSLAELLLVQGRVDEAERFALAARETVGPHDVTSLATTTMSLGLVRAAQGRDEEAEELLRQAYDTLAATDHRKHQCELLQALVQFLRERGRDDEADGLDARRDGVLAAAASTA